MRPELRPLRSMLILLALGSTLAACSDDPAAPEDPHATPVAAEVYLRGSDVRLADTHGDHWHGSVNTTLGVHPELDVRFLDAAGEIVPLGGAHDVAATIATGQPAGVVSVAAHGDHLELSTLAAGETRIVIHFRHDGHTEWSTPALRVVVSGS